jgi:hypothetical protein
MPVKKEIVKETPQKSIETPKIVAEPTTEIVVETKKPILEKFQKRESSLSLKSVFQPKEIEKTSVEENYDDYPKTVITLKQLELYWNEYSLLLEKKRRAKYGCHFKYWKTNFG